MYIGILRSANLARRCFGTAPSNFKNDPRSLAKQLHQKIKATGPITVAEYMKEVLTHPAAGYYMHRDVFGEKGDFITSPEISQMFGEMLAVWLLNEYQKFASPKPLQIIELGPGRGTLISDILRIFQHFNAHTNTSLHLVEVSPHLSRRQAGLLCQSATDRNTGPFYKDGVHASGIPVKWYHRLEDVPKGFSFVLAHEFFDALPVHKFHKTLRGYREVLIDIGEGDAPKGQFRYVLANNPTPMSKHIVGDLETRPHIEISPQSVIICQNICRRLVENGGLALFCDYGHNGEGTDTFRAFRDHKQVNPLVDPGSSDLTADVNFNTFKQTAEKVGGIVTFGPTTQRDFLMKIGIEYRYKSLMNKLQDDDHKENLKSSYGMLTDADQMGHRFKFFSMFPETFKRVLERYPVVGF